MNTLYAVLIMMAKFLYVFMQCEFLRSSSYSDVYVLLASSGLNLTIHSSVFLETLKRTSAFVSCPSTGEFMVCSILMEPSPNEEEPLTSSALVSLASATEELPSKTEFVSNFPSSMPMFVLPPALLLRAHK